MKTKKRFVLPLIIAMLFSICATGITTKQNGKWHDPSTWAGGTVPTDLDVVNIKHMVTVEQFHKCLTLTVAVEGSLIISSEGGLEVYKEFSNSGDVTIESDENGTGNLKVLTLIGAGVTNVQRYIPSGNWHILSCPVKGQNIKTFLDNTLNNIRTYSDTYDFGVHSEKEGSWVYNVPTGTVGAGEIPDFGNLGYAIRRNDAGVVNFSVTGGFNVGTISQAVTRNNFGWNCLGNPYTTAVLAGNFISHNRTCLDASYQSVYVWDPAIDDFKELTSWNVIAVGQGFFIKSAEAEGTIYFEDFMQAVAPTVPFKNAEIPWPSLELTVKAEGYANKTVVSFNNEMTSGLDPMYDIGKYKGNPDISLYTRLVEDNGVDFAVQALPMNGDIIKIPVGLEFKPGGEILFTAETYNLDEELYVFLEDKFTGAIELLNKENGVYRVPLEADFKSLDRFQLIISKSASTAIRNMDKIKNEFKIFVRDRFIIIEGNTNENTRLQVYGTDGKQWLSRYADDINFNRIYAGHLPSGIYLLKIIQPGIQLTEKIILTE